MSLQKKMACGTLWSVAEKGGQQFVSFLLFMVIARLVGPEEYGLAMLCFTYLSFSSLLLTSLADGVVALQIKDPAKLSTIFWLTLLTGVGLSVFCLASAGAAAAFFNEPRLASLLRWLSVVPVLLAGAAVPQMIIMQMMDFKIYAIRSLCGTLGSGIVGVILAYYGYGAHAIVIQQIILYLIANVVVWAFISWRPAFSVCFSGVLHDLRPGINMTGSNIVSFCEQQLPRIFIGQLLGPTSVGFFAFATRIRVAMQDSLVTPAFLTLFPALAEIRENKGQQDKVLGQVIFLIGLLMVPAIALLALTASLYVPLLFGDVWTETVPMLRLFIVMGLATPLTRMVTVICRAHNQMGKLLKVQIVLVGFSLATVYIFAQRGLMPVAWSIFWFAVVSVPIYLFYLHKWLGIDLWHQLKRLAGSLISTVLMLASAGLFVLHPLFENAWLDLATPLVVGAAVLLAANLVLQRQEILAIVRFVKGLAKNTKEEPAEPPCATEPTM